MAKKGCIPWNKGKKGLQTAWNKGLTKETDTRVKKYSENKKGKKLSEDQRDKIRKSKLGIKQGPLSEEHKRKISEANKGKKRRPKSKKEKQHLSNLLRGRKCWTKYTYELLMNKYPMIFEDHIIKQSGNFIEVRCTHCYKWFVPSRQDINEKLRQIKTGTGLKFLFCSDICKEASYLYRMKKDPVLLNDYRKYCRKVEIETRKSTKLHSDKIDNYNRRSYEYHLDHKFSMMDGFSNKVCPKDIGYWRNLQILTKFENESKGGKSAITLNEFEELFND